RLRGHRRAADGSTREGAGDEPYVALGDPEGVANVAGAITVHVTQRGIRFGALDDAVAAGRGVAGDRVVDREHGARERRGEGKQRAARVHRPNVERGGRSFYRRRRLHVNVKSWRAPVERRAGAVYRARMASAGDSLHTRSVLEAGGTKFLIHRLDVLGAR